MGLGLEGGRGISIELRVCEVLFSFRAYWVDRSGEGLGRAHAFSREQGTLCKIVREIVGDLGAL